MYGSMAKKEITHKLLKCSVLVLFILIFCVNAKMDRGERKRIDNSVEVLSQLMATPDNSVPNDIMDKAECIAVIPSVKKAAFIVGGNYGKGLVSCRRSGSGWTAPVFFALEGGSIGFQIGGESIDLVLFIMNKKGVNYLLEDKFTLGGDASVAAGPVGRTAKAETDAQMNAEILAYSRTQGLFAGISLNGAVMKPDKDANRNLYGRDISAKEILVNGNTRVPKETAAFVNALNKQSGNRQTAKNR
jgi:SH3 domain-containing YSC84-like protein 1